MPGIGDVIDGAIQQAPHPVRQSMIRLATEGAKGTEQTRLIQFTGAKRENGVIQKLCFLSFLLLKVFCVFRVFCGNHFPDMRIALRSLLKTPGFTIIALVTLALAIGVNTTQFTVLNRLLFFSQPFPEPGRLVQVWSTTPQWQSGSISPGDFLDLRDQNTVFERTAVYYVNYQKSIAKAGKPAELITAMAVSADFFATIGVPAVLGRIFTREEENKGEAPVILSHAYWEKDFASDPQVLGNTVRFNARNVPVVGVMPATLDDPQIWNGRVDLWHQDIADVNRKVRDKAWYSMVARLKSGVTVEQADAELKAIGTRLAHDFPQSNEKRGFRVAPYAPDYMGDIGRTVVWLIMGLSASVLLIGCVNLANLQLVRATGRSREYAIRLALGASRGQLMRLLLTESLLLSLAGGALGLLVAKWGNLYFSNYFNSPMPLDVRVLTFALVTSLVTGMVFGAIPTWLGSRADVNAALKQSGRGTTGDRARHRLRHGLIVVEVALTLALLSGAGFFVRGLQHIMDRELLWRPDNVLIGSFELGYWNYGDETNPRHEVFTDKFLTALRQLPGVDHATISFGSPAMGPGGGTAFSVESQTPPPPGQEPVALIDRVTPDYFETYGIHLLQGRTFNENDRQGAPKVVIINQAMAEKFWPGENPIGHRIRYSGPGKEDGDEIVGIVSNVVYGGDFIGQYPRYHFYQPWAQTSGRFPTFSLHSASNPQALGDAVRKALAGIEPDVAITQLATARETLKANLSGFSVVRRTLAQLAGLGLLLSLVGIYGVIANLTVERTQEVGVRMALGAQERDVVWLFLRNGIFLASLGTVIGAALSFGLLRFLSQRLVIVPGNDPWVVVGLALILASVAVFACWLPARRATKVDPVVALRAD